MTTANTRFQPADQAGLTGDQLSRLELKWAFGYPDAAQAWAQPAVAGGMVYVNSGYGSNGKPGNVLLAFGLE